MSEEKNELEVTSTNRGFALSEFEDRNGNKCSLQKSSAATAHCIWLGLNKNQYHERLNNEPLSPRMHLTQGIVARLIPALQRFVDTGDLEDYESNGINTFGRKAHVRCVACDCTELEAEELEIGDLVKLTCEECGELIAYVPKVDKGELDAALAAYHQSQQSDDEVPS